MRVLIFLLKRDQGYLLLTTSLSPHASPLLHAMVAYDPTRVTAHQALQHPYFPGAEVGPCCGQGEREGRGGGGVASGGGWEGWLGAGVP